MAGALDCLSEPHSQSTEHWTVWRYVYLLRIKLLTLYTLYHNSLFDKVHVITLHMLTISGTHNFTEKNVCL